MNISLSSPSSPSQDTIRSQNPAENRIDPRTEKINKKREEAEKVAQDFETMFIDLMVKTMRQTAQPEDKSNAEDIYQGMLDSEYSKAMTATQSFGIREQILNWLQQTDNDLRNSAPKDATEKPDKSFLSSNKLDTSTLQGDALALKAAAQAYQMSATVR